MANTGAIALATYLQGLGFDIDADFVNKLLVLLAVLVIECGEGLALAVGMALSGSNEREPDTASSAQTSPPTDHRTLAPDTCQNAPKTRPSQRPPAPDTVELGRTPSTRWPLMSGSWLSHSTGVVSWCPAPDRQVAAT